MVSKFLLTLLIPTLLFANLLSIPTSFLQPDPLTGWDAIGQAGGPTQGIAVQGMYAYLGVGPRLVILDISDPAKPHPVGATAPFEDLVQGVTVSGTLAYVTAGSAGLQIVDIRTPPNPSVVGTWDSPGYAEGVAVSGDFALLADGPYGLRVIDVTDPTSPLEIAHAFEMNYAADVAVSGRYAYLAAGGAGLLVVEISNPLYPIEAGTYDTPGYTRGVAVSGSQVVLADERNGLLILNASDPLHPALLGSLQMEGWAFDVTLSGSLAYVAAAFGGLRIVDFTNPAAPVEKGGISWPQSHAGGVFLANGRIFIADRKNGLRAIDASNPSSPIQVGYWGVFAFAHAVEVDNNYAYVAAGFNGVRIYSLSNPSHPVEVGSFVVDGLFYNLKLSGNRLYVGTMINSPERGLYVLDISDRANPKQIGYYQDVTECWGIDVTGNTVYVADGGDLKVFDFSNPPTLKLVGSLLMLTRGLTVRDNLAYVTQEFDGLHIYDVSNPKAISQVGSFKAANSFTHGPVGLSGNYAYITEQWGLRILNITNPAAPSEVSFTPTHAEANWLVLAGSRVYVSEGSYGFSVFDVSNPAVPQLLNQTSVQGAIQVLALNGGRLFTASGEGGLQIFGETAMGTQTQPALLAQPMQEAMSLPVSMPGQQRQTAHLPSEPPAQPQAPDRAPTTCTVSKTANSGSGTLRTCLENQVNGDVIVFSTSVFPPSAPATIHVGSERLPSLAKGNLTIDASNAGVILDGSNLPGGWVPGIDISSDHNTVRGLQIVNFPVGMDIKGNNNLIGGSRLVGSGPTGQGNVVSGNRQDGIVIHLGARDNLVLGNLVGLNASGTQAKPNQWDGITINQAPNNTIGSLNPGEENIISGNLGSGINLYGYANLNTKVVGNKIGTDITGNINLGNGHVGLYVESGSANTLVQRNLISGNQAAEVYVWDFGTDYTVLTGNHIGTNLAGTAPLPNLTSTGIATGNAAYTRIGGTSPGEGNVVANPGGVSVDSPFGANSRVTGNYIGLNAAGTAVLDGAGGLILSGATRTLVGGATPAEANFITTSGHFSLDLRSPYNVIAGNFMGLATDGVTPLATAGFQVLSLRDGNIIQGNHLAYSTSAGIWLDQAQANTLRRNAIWANPFKGIFLDNGANGSLPAPAFTLNFSGGSGTTCPGCTVELFLDEGNQGRVYLESLTADETGAFTFMALCPLTFPHLTATATDLEGNTSEFSDTQTIPWDCNSPRPIPTLVSLAPTTLIALSDTFLLIVNGTGFTADSTVRWNGNPLPTTILSSSLAQAAIPSYLLLNEGDFPVTIFTPAPGGGESSMLLFSISPPMKLFVPIVGR